MSASNPVNPGPSPESEPLPEGLLPADLPSVRPVSPTVARNQEAFRAMLPELVKNHYREWVAFHQCEPVAFGPSKTKLYRACLDKGWSREQFIVRSVEPETSVEIDPDGWQDR